MKHQNCIFVILKDGSTMQLYDVMAIRAYDGLEIDKDFLTMGEHPSHHAFTVRTMVNTELEPDGTFYIRSLSPKTPLVKPADEPGLAGLGPLPKDSPEPPS